MKPLPLDYVKRIFERLECTYKDRWLALYGNERRKNLYATIWSTGLTGLSVPEIKRALAICEMNPEADVPTHVDFYHYAKGLKAIPRRKQDDFERGNREIAKMHLDDIRNKLSGKMNVLHGT